jgi:zinc D-Ala-D-Ala carboxypeptidase
MNLTEHFTLDEFIASGLAARRGIDNSLPTSLLQAAHHTCALMERIRAALVAEAVHDVPVIITSGYRCVALNRALGSADTSDHILAAAVDFKAPSFGSAFHVARALADQVDELQIGQLIHEYGSWVHVSTRAPSRPVNRVITISRSGTFAGVQQVLT